jgi:mannose-1-phosphate guanylyltransferase
LKRKTLSEWKMTTAGQAKRSNIYAVIMAGGLGTRFWPASRVKIPKQFLTIIGSRTLVEETFFRVTPIIGKEQIYLVVNRLHRKLTEKIFQRHGVKILDEPVPRNTAAGIGLAAIHIRKEAGDVPLVILPADHFIADKKKFRNVLRAGISLVAEGGIATIGIAPTRAETGYGYIQKGKKLARVRGYEVFQVERFIEKPNQKTARRYLKSGDYLWNGGIFLFTTETILKEIGRHLPELHQGLRVIEGAIGTSKYGKLLEEVYRDLDNISIDYGVMEKTETSVYTIPGRFGWSDIGSWASLYDLNRDRFDKRGNLLKGKGLIHDTENTFVYSNSGRLVSTLGLKDLLIVDTPDALLLADKRRSQEVKKIIGELKKRKWKKWL